MYGPYKIAKCIGTHAARLKLPKTMKCHNIFHVSLLEPYRENKIQGRPETQPGPIEVSGDDEYEVERILRAEWRKASRGKRKWVEYLVMWKGYPEGDSTFETTDAFTGSSKRLLREFYKENPTAPKDSHLDLDVDTDNDNN